MALYVDDTKVLSDIPYYHVRVKINNGGVAETTDKMLKSALIITKRTF
ncbi:MAG: hypothetical protein PUB42_04700 [Firmicutes bacterium]|nr:hypothetical protein [Bacillota bacterium]